MTADGAGQARQGHLLGRMVLRAQECAQREIAQRLSQQVVGDSPVRLETNAAYHASGNGPNTEAAKKRNGQKAASRRTS